MQHLWHTCNAAYLYNLSHVACVLVLLRPHRWFGARHTWMGLLDPDEYLVILPQEQLSLTRR
jgi:hypothetical protein